MLNKFNKFKKILKLKIKKNNITIKNTSLLKYLKRKL